MSAFSFHERFCLIQVCLAGIVVVLQGLGLGGCTPSERPTTSDSLVVLSLQPADVARDTFRWPEMEKLRDRRDSLERRPISSLPDTLAHERLHLELFLPDSLQRSGDSLTIGLRLINRSASSVQFMHAPEETPMGMNVHCPSRGEPMPKISTRSPEPVITALQSGDSMETRQRIQPAADGCVLLGTTQPVMPADSQKRIWEQLSPQEQEQLSLRLGQPLFSERMVLRVRSASVATGEGG